MNAQEQRELHGLKFDPTPMVITVVTGAVGVGGSQRGAANPLGAEELWTASIDVTAWQSDAGEVPHREKTCRLEQLVDHDGLDALQKALLADSIYTVRVRRGNDYLTPAEVKAKHDLDAQGLNSADDTTRFLLLEVLPTRPVPALAAVLAEQTAPKVFESKALGVFTENRSVNWYGRDVTWLGREVGVSMEAGTTEQLEKMAGVLASLVSDASRWQTGATAYAASQLLELRNMDWAEDGDPALTAQQFADRMTLAYIHVPEANGSFSLEFDDGDLFWGHRINVEGNLDGTFRNAQI